MGLAGCGESGTDSTGVENRPETATGTETPTGSVSAAADPTITGSITTENAECGSQEGAAGISFDQEEQTVTVDGTISASNPCHEAVLSKARYDAESNAVTVTVTTESTGEMCQECLGSVEYRATVDFEESLPTDVIVKHGAGDSKTVAETSR